MFLLRLSLLSRIVPLPTDSVFPLLPTELQETLLSSEVLRFNGPSGSSLNDRRNMPLASLFTRNRGPGSEEFSRFSGRLRLKLGDLDPEVADKFVPAFILFFIASLICFTMSRFSSSVLKTIIKHFQNVEIHVVALIEHICILSTEIDLACNGG